MPVYTRISARKGSYVRLNVAFYANGLPSDPHAIRRIDIYQNKVDDDNLVAQIDVLEPDETGYPLPLVQELDSNGDPLPGRYYYDLLVPDDFVAPDSYIDQWWFIGDELVDGTTPIDYTDETLWDSQCFKWWLTRSSTWYGDDELITPRFEFQQLDKNLTKPEIRTIEVGIIPVPRYDYDYNRIAPLMASLDATITIETINSETVINEAQCTIGLRQGSIRDNPFVIRYRINSGSFIIGTYKYWVTLTLPNGETRSSPAFFLSID